MAINDFSLRTSNDQKQVAVSIAVPDYAVPPGNKSISNIALLS